VTTGGGVQCYGAAAAGVTAVPPGVYQGVATGNDVACGVTRNHTVVCWGDAANPIIASLPIITDATNVSVGAAHACYITTTSGVVCWGNNSAGQTAVPAGVGANSTAWWLSAGGDLTCAILGANLTAMAPPGRLECWGGSATAGNWSGQWSGGGPYEVACAAWGCIVSEDGGGGTAWTAFMAASFVNAPIPREYHMARFVGSAERGYCDSNSTATQFDSPSGMAMHDDGTFAVADVGNGLIRRVNTLTGDVTTIAGWYGVTGHLDSDSPLNAVFGYPYGMAYDGAGNLYVGDAGAYFIRKVAPDGTVTTVAGNLSTRAPAADGVGTDAIVGAIRDMRYDGASDVLYFADADNGRVRALYPNMSVGTVAALSAGVNSLALVGSQRVIYVGTNYGIHAVSYDGGSGWLFSGSATVAGYVDGLASAARFNNVSALERDAVGCLYVVDTNNARIRRVSPVGAVVTVLGASPGNVDGIGTGGLLGHPWGMRMEPMGDAMYIVDTAYSTVRRAAILYIAPSVSIAVGPVTPAGGGSSNGE